jgi:hypothetical protein
MTKMIKMSLIAATAVAGMSSVATAQNLEDAIKGVDVSGYVDYRREYKSTEGAKSLDVNEYNVNVTLTSKVNDIVKATVSAGFDETQTGNTGTTSGDGVAPISVDQANFTFDLGATTVIAGKQSIPSAFVDKIDTVKQGDGIVVLHKVSDALTVAGAHFTNNNIGSVYGSSTDTAKDMVGAGILVTGANTKTTELIAMGKVAVVDYAVHYNSTVLGSAQTVGPTEADHMFIKLGADVSGVKIGFKHATASTDSSAGTKWDDASVTALSASTKLASASVSATYFTADKSGANAKSDVALDGDNDAEAHVKVWQLSTAAISNEGSGFAIGGSMPVADKLTAALTYAMATDDATSARADIDYAETLVSLTYKMSKNFTLHGRYSMLDKDTGATDKTTDYSRIQVKYTF